MKIYLAGNFPQMNRKGEEERIFLFSLQFTDVYKRLVSFYYYFSDNGKSVLELKKNENISCDLVRR